MRRKQREISLEEKLRYLQEIENIHRLSKKVLPPKGTTWARIADKHLQKALGMPLREDADPLRVQAGKHMHQHSPRTARVIERTLRNGIVHPDVLHSFRNDSAPLRRQRFFAKQRPRADDHEVIHYVQHGSTDLEYPSGHMQGYGFVPGTHEVASHVQLEDSMRPFTDTVPSKGGVAASEAYH